jgi:hypothetical protein|tara:strand:+ start:670 stop:1158 length:489 start_codon:yes stop_codon:yes gene_type:complete
MEKFVRIPGRRKVLTRNMIETSIESTRSNAEAARWLGVSYNTYKKWSKYYGLFEKNLNQSGKGVPKKPSKFKIELQEVFDGKHEDYPSKILKKRLVGDGLLKEECSICGWNEERITDNKICLHLDYIDGNEKNKEYDNLRLVCSNCHYTNVGDFKSSKIFCQ